MASTAPVFGSRTTIAPSLFAVGGNVDSAYSAASCSFGSTVSVTLSVMVGSFSRKRI